MAAKDSRFPVPQSSIEPTPFDSTEEAWFWFIQANQARIDGARISRGLSDVPRPCEPVDILRILDRLYRNRLLVMDHFLVMRHYGRRMLPPDPRRVREVRAFRLWREALSHLEAVLVRKGIVVPPAPRPHENWFMQACIYENNETADA